MKKYLALLFFIGITQALLSQNTPIYQDTIPFRNDLGLIIVPITFNGEVKEFAFDTGAQITLSYAWASSELKKTRKTTTVTSSSGLKSKMRFYKSGTISFGSRKITGHRILNTPQNEIFTCYQLDGILGVDIIQQFNWVIDYENKILIMHPPDYFPDQVDDMYALDFDFQNNRPFVFLKREAATFTFLLDTGAGGTSNISKRNYKLTNIDDYPQATMYSGNFDVNGIFTSSKPIVFQFPEAISEDVVLSPKVYYNNAKSTKIGNSLWRGKQLFLSLKNDKLYLSQAGIIETKKGYSFAVTFKEGKMIVIRLREGSDLWNEGVRQGDEIQRYDGKKFDDFCSLDQYQRKLVRSGESFEIQLTNGKTFTISKQALFN